MFREVTEGNFVPESETDGREQKYTPEEFRAAVIIDANQPRFGSEGGEETARLVKKVLKREGLPDVGVNRAGEIIKERDKQLRAIGVKG